MKYAIEVCDLQNCLIMKKVFCLVILFTFVIAGYAQDTILMGVSGHKDTVSNYCVLFDDGGSNGNHSSRVNASYTIRATNPSHHFKVTIISKLDYYNNSSIDRVNLEVLKGGRYPRRT